MGQVQSVFDSDGKKSGAPTNYVVPPFPSLYNPSLSSTILQKGFFLHDADAIWRFTFYWTLILLFGIFEICAFLAVINLILSRTAFKPPTKSIENGKHSQGMMRRIASAAASVAVGGTVPAGSGQTRRIRRRPPLWLVIFIPIVMGAIAAFVALVSGTVVGFALAAVYSAGGFSMSTWVPFMWALIQVVVIIISSYTSLTRIL